MSIREVHVVHHTHVDVGYTDLQPVIYEKHVEYLEQVLDCCARTDPYPDASRFRWVCEFSWPMLRFLQERPALAEPMARRLREGRVELAGLFLDPTDLVDRRAFEVSLTPALELARRVGFEVTTAMTTDIPGQGWALADVLAEHGLPYLSVAPNAMVSKPILVERPFWWVGPRGGRVLVWQTDWRQGWYGEGHVLGFPQGFTVARARLQEYLDLLQAEGYPWDVLLLHFGADNHPPCPELPDLVRQWNEQPEAPRLRLSTHREFFARLRELHGDASFPVRRAAWPDWWSEGLGSAAFETALSRATHCRLQRLEALQRTTGDTTDLWPIFEDLLFFDEHTWGCQDMALQPYAFESRASFAFKASHVYRCFDRARRLEDRLTRQVAEAATPAPGRGGGATFFNPLGREYSGPRELPAFAATLPALADGSPLQSVPATPLRPAATFAWVRLRAGEAKTVTGSPGPAAVPPASPGEHRLANEFFRLDFDRRGRLLSLLDLQANRELLDARAPWGFAETLHEQITGAADRAAVWQRGSTRIPYGHRRTDAPFRRAGALEHAEMQECSTGPLFASLTWRSHLPWVRLLETEVRLWHGARRIDVEVRLDKQPCERYESLYVAFPFAFDTPRAFIHNCDAVFEAEREQLPGTCRDFYAVQHFAAVTGDWGWAVLCPVEAPLVQLGRITFGRWADHLELTQACLYSWLTNNFWYTNFPGYQQGNLTFHFSLTAGAGTLDLDAACRFGEDVRVGLAQAGA